MPLYVPLVVTVVYSQNLCSVAFSCVEPDGASYLSYILGEKEQQREATVTTDTKKDNSVVTEEQEKDFVENGDSDVKFLDYDDVTTIKPALPWDLEISEGDPSDGKWYKLTEKKNRTVKIIILKFE